MDNVTFLCHAAIGPESWTALRLEEVCQVAVPAGRKTTTVFARVHKNASLGRSLPSTIDLSAITFRQITNKYLSIITDLYKKKIDRYVVRFSWRCICSLNEMLEVHPSTERVQSRRMRARRGALRG